MKRNNEKNNFEKQNFQKKKNLKTKSLEKPSKKKLGEKTSTKHEKNFGDKLVVKKIWKKKKKTLRKENKTQ